jgi:hypothetical protein
MQEAGRPSSSLPQGPAPEPKMPTRPWTYLGRTQKRHNQNQLMFWTLQPILVCLHLPRHKKGDHSADMKVNYAVFFMREI